MTDLEDRGVATVFVASREFEGAVEAQAQAIGSSVAAVFVPHPIQDRTDQEMRALAEAAVSAIVGALTS